jgi:purine-nucleoside phosphorylase
MSGPVAIEPRRVAEDLRATLGLVDDSPVLAIILGSGLGGLVARIESPRSVPYQHIPGFAPPGVAGHAGELIAGHLAGRRVLTFGGRMHVYEGHTAAASALPVRIAAALGVRTLFVSNAAGGVRRTFRPGDLMVINDHVNLMWRNPLIGPVATGEMRFPDMSSPYDPALRELLHACGRDRGLVLQDGVYVGLTGPSYETPAEVRMLERMGADAVGMSTVPEVLVARALHMRVAGVSCITNQAAGLTAEPIDHEHVLDVTRRAAVAFEELVLEFVSRL